MVNRFSMQLASRPRRILIGVVSRLAQPEVLKKVKIINKKVELQRYRALFEIKPRVSQLDGGVTHPLQDLPRPSSPVLETSSQKKHVLVELRYRMEKEVDVWIAQLRQCKQLEESSIKLLCEKVWKLCCM